MMLNSIGNKIVAARKKVNLSQAELAQQVAISPQAVGKWERGESLPDITTLNRLAEILQVDLNYFSDQFPSKRLENVAESVLQEKSILDEPRKEGRDWNMSSGNWVDADFSGLKNLKEKFSSSNIKNCQFMHSDLSELVLANNNIEKCDFTGSNLQTSKFQGSNLLSNNFSRCSFANTIFLRNNIGKGNFTEVDFTGAEFTSVNFESNVMQNAILKFTSFKNSAISDVLFEGMLEDCHFEGCTFYKVKFHNATLLNTFFKYNKRLKKVEFVNCKVDKLTYAFLKNNQADLTGITVLS